jgi:hypothetical protein
MTSGPINTATPATHKDWRRDRAREETIVAAKLPPSRIPFKKSNVMDSKIRRTIFDIIIQRESRKQGL